MNTHKMIMLMSLLLMLAGMVLPGAAVPPHTETPEGAAASAESRPELEVAVGQIIGFGTWEQDGDPANGPEEIEWQVLRIEDDFALVMSVKGLDARPWHVEKDAVDWDNSSLRAWLNGEFYNSAFTSSEKNRIREVWNSNPDNPEYGTEGGNDTQDRIFLLSIDEAFKYFSNAQARQRKPTAFAKANGAYVSTGEDYKGNGYWWLRSPGYGHTYAAYVDSYGDVRYFGFNVDSTDALVCPAFWLNL